MYGNEYPSNLAKGEGCLSKINPVTDSSNVAMGQDCLDYLSNGDCNTALGINTLNQLTTGSNNSAIGYNAGTNCITGSNNTFFGLSAKTYDSLVTYNNSTAIGANATITASNQIVLGTASETVYIPGKLGVGTTKPTSSLNVNGTCYLKGNVTLDKSLNFNCYPDYISTNGIFSIYNMSSVDSFDPNKNNNRIAYYFFPYTSSQSTYTFSYNGSGSLNVNYVLIGGGGGGASSNKFMKSTTPNTTDNVDALAKGVTPTKTHMYTPSNTSVIYYGGSGGGGGEVVSGTYTLSSSTTKSLTIVAGKNGLGGQFNSNTYNNGKNGTSGESSIIKNADDSSTLFTARGGEKGYAGLYIQSSNKSLVLGGYSGNNNQGETTPLQIPYNVDIVNQTQLFDIAELPHLQPSAILSEIINTPLEFTGLGVIEPLTTTEVTSQQPTATSTEDTASDDVKQKISDLAELIINKLIKTVQTIIRNAALSIFGKEGKGMAYVMTQFTKFLNAYKTLLYVLIHIIELVKLLPSLVTTNQTANNSNIFDLKFVLKLDTSIISDSLDKCLKQLRGITGLVMHPSLSGLKKIGSAFKMMKCVFFILGDMILDMFANPVEFSFKIEEDTVKNLQYFTTNYTYSGIMKFVSYCCGFACELLKNLNETISNISGNYGFDNLSLFFPDPMKLVKDCKNINKYGSRVSKKTNGLDTTINVLYLNIYVVQLAVDILQPGDFNLLNLLNKYAIDPLGKLTLQYASEFGGILEDGIMRFTSYVDPDEIIHFLDSSIIDAINIDFKPKIGKALKTAASRVINSVAYKKNLGIVYGKITYGLTNSGIPVGSIMKVTMVVGSVNKLSFEANKTLTQGFSYANDVINNLDARIGDDVNAAVGAVSSIGKTAVGAIGSAIKKITRRCVIS